MRTKKELRHQLGCDCDRCQRRDLDDLVDVDGMGAIKKREKTFEYQLRDELKVSGVLFVKLKPMIDGMPDRLAMGFGEMKLVEIKREGEPLEKHQEAMHDMLLRRHGLTVITVWSPNVKDASRIVINGLNPYRKHR